MSTAPPFMTNSAFVSLTPCVVPVMENVPWVRLFMVSFTPSGSTIPIFCELMEPGSPSTTRVYSPACVNSSAFSSPADRVTSLNSNVFSVAL